MGTYEEFGPISMCREYPTQESIIRLPRPAAPSVPVHRIGLAPWRQAGNRPNVHVEHRSYFRPSLSKARAYRSHCTAVSTSMVDADMLSTNASSPPSFRRTPMSKGLPMLNMPS